MEARKITVISTLSQSKYVLMSEAETLGELKKDLDANNIIYTNLDFHEGLSKTQPLSDDSVLPTNIMYKGTTTNELIFRLTNPHKKYEGGNRSRQLIFADIKAYNLESVCLDVLGNNYTRCKSADLEALIAEHIVLISNNKKVVPEKIVKKYSISPDILDASDILNILVEDKVITEQQYDLFSTEELESTFSADEIDELFANI